MPGGGGGGGVKIQVKHRYKSIIDFLVTGISQSHNCI